MSRLTSRNKPKGPKVSCVFCPQNAITESTLANRQCCGNCTVGRMVGVRGAPAQGRLLPTCHMRLLIHLLKCLSGTETWWELGQLEALCVEAVPFFAGDSLE